MTGAKCRQQEEASSARRCEQTIAASGAFGRRADGSGGRVTVGGVRGRCHVIVARAAY